MTKKVRPKLIIQYRTVCRTVFLLTLLTPFHSIAQSPLSFFPYGSGNMWEYYWVEGSFPVDTLQSFMYQDSTDFDGRIYLKVESRFINPVVQRVPITFVIDTTLKLVWGDVGYGYGPMHKLDAQQGDQWVMVNYGTSYEMCRVVSIREEELFGVPTTTKDYLYFLAADSTDTTGLHREARSLSSGFGLTYEGGGDLFHYIIIKGAVIDSTLYGDTTSVITSVAEPSTGLPTELELSQNYPNPFNPTTRIQFSLTLPDRITLVIYDGLGREIRKLIDGKEYAVGTYEVEWDGKTNLAHEVPSGAYYYRLRGHGNNITRSMTLLR